MVEVGEWDDAGAEGWRGSEPLMTCGGGWRATPDVIARSRFSRHQTCALCNRPYKRYEFASLEPSGQRLRTKAEERSWPSYDGLI